MIICIYMCVCGGGIQRILSPLSEIIKGNNDSNSPWQFTEVTKQNAGSKTVCT